MPATLEGFRQYVAKAGRPVPPDRVLLAALGAAKCGGKGGKPGPCPEGMQNEPVADAPKPKTAHPQTNTPEFKAWFGDSKVVDTDGKPLVVYHGTNSDFSEFKTTGIGEFGPGIYLSSDPTDAGSYALQRGKTEGARTLPTFVRMANPFVITANENPTKFFDAFPTAKTDEETISQAKAAGFDGIVYHRPTGSEQGAGSGVTHYIAFDPTQIKSATANKGKFDPKDPNITKTWLDRAVKRAWQCGDRAVAKGGPGSGIRGHKTERPVDPADAPTAKQGPTTLVSPSSAVVDKFKEILAARKDKWGVDAFNRDLNTPMSNPPPGYEGDVHVPSIVSETQARTAEKLRLHKLSQDAAVPTKVSTKARVALARMGGLSADEQKIADLCKSLLGVHIGAVLKTFDSIAKCGGPGSGVPGPCPENKTEQPKPAKPSWQKSAAEVAQEAEARRQYVVKTAAEVTAIREARGGIKTPTDPAPPHAKTYGPEDERDYDAAASVYYDKVKSGEIPYDDFKSGEPNPVTHPVPPDIQAVADKLFYGGPPDGRGRMDPAARQIYAQYVAGSAEGDALHKRLNEAARNGVETPEYRAMVDTIEKYQTTFPSPINTYRGVSLSPEKQAALDAELAKAAATGGTIGFKGITSTSLSPAQAKSFAGRHGAQELVFEIRTKTGLYAAMEDDHNYHEQEVIHGPSKRYRVVADAKDIIIAGGRGIIKRLVQLEEV